MEEEQFAEKPRFCPPRRWSNALMLLSTSIIAYLSAYFSVYTIHELDHWVQLLVLVPFATSVFMTCLSLWLTFRLTPGYLPKKFETPLTNEGYAPVRTLRIYNMRTWLACGIFAKDTNA